MDFLWFLSAITAAFLLNGLLICETASLRSSDDLDKWESAYPPLPGTEVDDLLWQNVVYNLYTPSGDVLKYTRGEDDFDGKIEVGSSYEADQDENKTTRFVFLTRDSKNGTHPGMAAIIKNDSKDNGRFGYVRFLSAAAGNKAFLSAGTRTAFNPVVCLKKEHHFPCEDKKYLAVYPKKADNCTEPPTFYLDFAPAEAPTNSRRLDKDAGDSKAYLSAVDPNKNATHFILRPVINRAKSVVQTFEFLKSPEEMLSEAKDVKLGISEVVINKGDATYTHEISHEYETSHESTVETFATISASLTVKVEVSGGLEFPGVGSASASVEGGVSIEASSTNTETNTKGESEKLKMTQRIIVGPNTRMRCTAFFKVVPKSTIGFVATALVSVFWSVYDPVSNSVVPRPAPLSVALAEVARNVKGWDIIGSEGDAVQVKFRGAVTAEHGISTIFSSEPLE